MDFVGRCRGQIKVEISPEISSQILRQKYRQRNLLVEDQPITQSNVHKLLSPREGLLLTSTYNSPQTTAVKIKEAAHHPPRPQQPPKKALWNLPEIPSLDETKDHRSILQKKLGELDLISNGLKGKLHQGREGQEPLFATAASAPPPMPSSSSTNDLQEDLQRLRSCLETQLTQMQNTLNKGQNLREIENQPEKEVDPPSENQELPRPRMEPDGGNPNESKIDTATHSVRSNSSKE